MHKAVLGTQVGSMMIREWLSPTIVTLTLTWCYKSAPTVLSSISKWHIVCFLQLPLLLCHSLSARGLTLKKNSYDTCDVLGQCHCLVSASFPVVSSESCMECQPSPASYFYPPWSLCHMALHFALLGSISVLRRWLVWALNRESFRRNCGL